MVEKAKPIAAHMLEVDPDDIEYEGGKAFVKGAPATAKTIQEIAGAAALGYDLPEGVEPFLDDTSYYDPPNCTFPFGAHIAVVEVDGDTGEVNLLRYVAVDDVGKVINPLICEGQIRGGIAQGAGQALLENIAYDRHSGQLLTGSFADYLLPTASDFPRIRAVALEDKPSPNNPLGAKGAGEGGTIPVGGVIANAVAAALSSLGVQPRELPLSPPRVWELIETARSLTRPVKR